MTRNIKDLEHVTRPLRGGKGQVVVLNTGALIGPEAEAMLQALHSRSIGGINAHLRKLIKYGAEKFMKANYVGYGHKSIGDCGTVTVFVEGVSMLVAKAIQDWPLYSGQESSTRYLDFSKQEFIDPVKTGESAALLERQRKFYLLALDELVPHLVKKHPRGEGEKESVYEKAINARAFDIARSLLPAGAATNLAWHMNLRQLADHLALLRHHPLEEVREVALAVEDALLEAYPNSFSKKRYPATEEYNAKIMASYYFSLEYGQFYFTLPTLHVTHDGIDRELLSSCRSIMEERPPKTELPKQMAECGTIQFKFPLDFGSFRDIQRHRAVVQRMPLVTNRHGFEDWYIRQMPLELKSWLRRHLGATLIGTTENLNPTPELRQYYTQMGYRLPNRLTGNLHALTYLVELRATSFVHPTLQIVAHKMADELRSRFGEYGLVLHTDDTPGRFDVRRGEHDIVEKDV